MIEIEHPTGMIVIDLDVDFTDGKQELRRAALIRTARRIFEGQRVRARESVGGWQARRQPPSRGLESGSNRQD